MRQVGAEGSSCCCYGRPTISLTRLVLVTGKLPARASCASCTSCAPFTHLAASPVARAPRQGARCAAPRQRPRPATLISTSREGCSTSSQRLPPPAWGRVRWRAVDTEEAAAATRSLATAAFSVWRARPPFPRPVVSLARALRAPAPAAWSTPPPQVRGRGRPESGPSGNRHPGGGATGALPAPLRPPSGTISVHHPLRGAGEGEQGSRGEMPAGEQMVGPPSPPGDAPAPPPPLDGWLDAGSAGGSGASFEPGAPG